MSRIFGRKDLNYNKQGQAIVSTQKAGDKETEVTELELEKTMVQIDLGQACT
jgi:hypothetical protein